MAALSNRRLLPWWVLFGVLWFTLRFLDRMYGIPTWPQVVVFVVYFVVFMVWLRRQQREPRS